MALVRGCYFLPGLEGSGGVPHAMRYTFPSPGLEVKSVNACSSWSSRRPTVAFTFESEAMDGGVEGREERRTCFFCFVG